MFISIVPPYLLTLRGEKPYSASGILTETIDRVGT
jgi:hypothetical protein